MKKYKKITVIITIVSIIIGILGIFSSVRAVSSSDFHTESAPKPTGSTYTASASNLEIVWDNAYCLQYGDSLTDSSMKFTVSDFVEIRGNKAYFYDIDGNLNLTTSNSRNNILAGILSEGAFGSDDSWNYGMHSSYEGAVYNSSGSLGNIYSKAQLGLWYYMSTWSGYSNSNGTNPSWSYKAPSSSKNTLGETAFDEVNVENGDGVKFNVDIYRLTSSSYQDILLVYPASSDGGSSSGGETTPTPTDFSVMKEWWYDGGSDMQPSGIKITLYGNGTEVKQDNDGNSITNPVTLNSSNSELLTYKSIYPDYYTDDCSDLWLYTFNNLPTEDSSGNTITYTAKESVANTSEQDNFDAYTQGYYTGDDYYAFYNELYTSITVKKEWDDNSDGAGKRPTSVTVELYANGEATTDTLILKSSNNWTGVFSELPQYQDGKKVEYTIKEVEVDGYTSTQSWSGNTCTITNTYTPGTTTVTVTKKWDDNSNAEGKRPESISIILYANGESTKTATFGGSGNEWSYTFTDLPIETDGTTITYTVEEGAIDRYTNSISGSAEAGFVITNTYVPETSVLEEIILTNTHTPEKINITVTKKWEDNSNANNIRPESITVGLYANGTLKESATLSGTGDEWTYTFENLYKYESGKEIVYTVEESAVDGYTTEETTGDSSTGFIITNKIKDEKTTVKVTKIWDDDSNRDGKRPETITIELYGEIDGEEVKLDEATFTGEGDTWEYVFTDVPETTDGKLVKKYIFKEKEISNGYYQVGAQ